MENRAFANFPELQQIFVDCGLESILDCDHQTFRKKLKSIFNIEISPLATLRNLNYFYILFKLEEYKRFVNNLKNL